MSTDLFEDTLRDLLRDTADAAGPGYLEPDPEQVIGLGRRVVRRRRYATGLVAASVLAVAGVGFAAFGAGTDRTSTPADTTSTSTWVTGPVTADLTRSASMGPTWGPADVEPSVQVGVDIGRRSLTSSLIGPDGELSGTASAILPANTQAATWTSAAEPAGLLAGVVPAAAKDVIFLWAGEPGSGTLDLEPLTGTPYQAFATWVEPGPDGAPPLHGLLWTDRTKVYDSQGGEVRSARDGTVVAFVDRTMGVLGVFDDGASSIATLSDGVLPSVMSSSVESGSDVMKTTALLVLPAGATAVSVTASDRATVTATQTHSDGTTGDTLVVARLDVTPGLDHGVKGVTWINADGSPGAGVVSE